MSRMVDRAFRIVVETVLVICGMVLVMSAVTMAMLYQYFWYAALIGGLGAMLLYAAFEAKRIP